MILSALVIMLIGHHAFARKTMVSINEIVDLKLELANRIAVATNRTTVEYGSGLVPGLMSYEGATGIGLDTLVRTGDCSMVFEGDTITYDFSIGQSILATFFRKITVGEKTGSGYYRALNNSLEFSYSVSYNGTECSIRLNRLKVSMSRLEAFIGEETWNSEDSVEFQDLLEKIILPGLNRKLEQKHVEIENNLETIFCKGSGHEMSTQGLDMLRKFLF